MQKIGLMMVVRNEAHRIEKFLEHTLPFVDAVCICDQQSDDGTWEILQGLHITKIPFIIWQDEKHGYSEPSKQATADKLDVDWLLYLDPDEIASVKFLREMHDLVEKNADVDGYQLIRQNFFRVRVYGENTPIQPKVLEVLHPARDLQLRLTRKKYSQFPAQIHCRVRVKREDMRERIQKTDYTINHTKTLEEQFSDDKRYEEPVAQVKANL